MKISKDLKEKSRPVSFQRGDLVIDDSENLYLIINNEGDDDYRFLDIDDLTATDATGIDGQLTLVAKDKDLLLTLG